MIDGRPAYRIGTVCKLLNISRSTLNGWINDGHAMGLSSPSRSRGSFRPFTGEDIVRVAVFARLRELGIDKKIADTAAQAVAITYLDRRAYDTPLFLVQRKPYGGDLKTSVVPAPSIGIRSDSEDVTVVLPLTPMIKDLVARLDALEEDDDA